MILRSIVMIFNEKKFEKVKDYGKVFIYFLCKEKEVVYVGQTRQGLYRPFSHTNKDFDEIMICQCEEEDLDYMENEFILKYKPKYNNSLNLNCRYTIKMAMEKIKADIEPSYNMRKIKKDIENYAIRVDKFKRFETINLSEFEWLYKLCKEKYEG